jgi:cytochrome c
MFSRTAAAAALSLALASPGSAAPDARQAEAVSLVKRGVAYIHSHGAERAYAEINDRQGALAEAQLYLVVYALDGRCLAHGANPRQVGHDLLGTTDVDGRFIVAERVALARAQPAGFWQETRTANPMTRSVEPRLVYCERLGDTAVCGGRLR